MDIQFTNSKEADELGVTLSIKGQPSEVIKVLVDGLPREALIQLKDAFEAEVAKRKTARQ